MLFCWLRKISNITLKQNKIFMRLKEKTYNVIPIRISKIFELISNIFSNDQCEWNLVEKNNDWITQWMKHIYSKKIKFCKTFTYKLEKLTKRFNDADGAQKKKENWFHCKWMTLIIHWIKINDNWRYNIIKYLKFL